MTRLRQSLLDVLIAAALAGAMLVELVTSDVDRDFAVAVPLILLAVLPTLVRHHAPALAVAGCMGGLFLVIGTLEIFQTVPFPSMLSGYALALVSSRRRTVVAGLLLVPFVLLAIQLNSPHGIVTMETAKNLGFVALPLLLGVVVQDRRNQLAALVERAESAERTREEETLRRVGEERLRIARDVHDAVAHAMVAINVQAGVAAHIIEQDRSKAHAMLVDIKRVSGEALADLRTTLGIVRTSPDDVPVSPASGFEQIDDLGSALRAAGVVVDIEIGTAVTSLPSSLGTTGYRIVQEALTNVLRHAHTSHARVSVQRDHEHLLIAVSDDGTGRPGPDRPSKGSGTGVRGMKERALALGGTLEAGPRPDGGWQVHARIPISSSS